MEFQEFWETKTILYGCWKQWLHANTLLTDSTLCPRYGLHTLKFPWRGHETRKESYKYSIVQTSISFFLVWMLKTMAACKVLTDNTLCSRLYTRPSHLKISLKGSRKESHEYIIVQTSVFFFIGGWLSSLNCYCPVQTRSCRERKAWLRTVIGSHTHNVAPEKIKMAG